MPFLEPQQRGVKNNIFEAFSMQEKLNVLQKKAPDNTGALFIW